MNNDPDDAQFEHDLRTLRPAAASRQLEDRLAGLLSIPGIPPSPRTTWWHRLGFALPAAAWGWGLLSPAAAVLVTIITIRLKTEIPLPSPPTAQAKVVTGSTPSAKDIFAGKETGIARAANVLYGATDEGVAPDGDDGLSRQVRYRSTDHVQWRNPRTGAQWEVSYPREDVLLVPVNAE